MNRDLTTEFTGFFSILAEWPRAEGPEPANNTRMPGETAETIAKAQATTETPSLSLLRIHKHQDLPGSSGNRAISRDSPA